MRQTLLVTVAAAALAAGSTLALSQRAGQGGGGAGPSSAPQATSPTEKQDQKSTQERTSPAQKQDQKSTQQERSQPGTQQRQTETPQGGAKQGGDTKGTAQGTGQGKGSMTSSSVSLTTEQKTQIRSTVLTSGPKVTNVNFNVRVGTVVPRTIRIVPVPATLIEIQPAWRGYLYFVYADEIIIVEPRTLKIVAVLEV